MFASSILFGVLIATALGANILFITVVPSSSHHIWHEVLVEELLVKGHNITMLGYERPNIQSKNYTIIRIEGSEALREEDAADELVHGNGNAVQKLRLIWYIQELMSSINLRSDALKVLLAYPKDMFDLIVFDIVAGPWLYPLVENFGNPPVVAVSPFAIPPYIADALGTHFYSYYPVYMVPYTDDMTFLQRVENTLLYQVDRYLKWYYTPILYKKSQKRYGDNIVPFDQVEKQMSILLTNYDPLLDYPQPLPPHIIPIGGLHVKPAKKLSDELLQIVDTASEGVIYFSFGTNVDPSMFTAETKQMFLNTFSKLRQIVLWKYNKDDLKNVPKNVIVKKWFVQNDVLGHKNVKLFITHNGALSTQEAMYHGVPLVGIPFFMDQISIAAKVEAKVLGKTLTMATLTEDALYSTIQEVLTNPIYAKNMRNLSKKFRDRSETPLERAIYWLEYVLRHKDVSELSIRGRYMSTYQRENLDVAGFILICVLVLVFSVYIVIKCLITAIFKKKKVHKIKRN